HSGWHNEPGMTLGISLKNVFDLHFMKFALDILAVDVYSRIILRIIIFINWQTELILWQENQ
ncbi:hypothetical protein, partial [Klebsiella pneumoniae]|uniref:hypothetical protein n=1 Tax=Klebsiella pneumoniae TaxID=573 RepID=UPI001D0D8D79